MDFGCWIPIVSGIPYSLSYVPDSKAHDSGFHKPKFPGFGNQDSFTWGDSLVSTELKIKGKKNKNWLLFNMRYCSPCDIRHTVLR